MSGVRVPAPPPLPSTRRVRLRRVEPVLRRALNGPCACPPGARVLVAVSGGADSVALLRGLVNIAHEHGLEIHAAHLHHGLRGAAADGDQAFVRALCARLDVPLIAARWNAKARMERRGLRGQAGLRLLRREFLLAAARRARATAIATAHTADDQLETLLMRLLRGTGLTGLAGMRPRRGRWIKPLLEATRHMIESDLGAARQPWREDATNRDPRYLRNRLRHRAIPALLEAADPASAAEPSRRGAMALKAARAAAEVLAAERFLQARARRTLSAVGSIQGGEFALDSRRAAAYPSGFQRTLLRRIWSRLAPTSPGLTHLHLSALSRLIERPRAGAIVRLPAGWTARRDRETMVFRAAAEARREGRGRARS